MVSRKLAALAFIEDYWALHHASPSLGEIAAALGGTTSRQDARDLVGALVQEGMVHRRPGRRGITLTSERERAIALLRRDGMTVLEAGQLPPGLLQGSFTMPTNPPLLMLPELDHIPDVEIGKKQHGSDAS